MKNKILFTTALNDNGNLIHVDTASKGLNYFCPECKQEFILRKSGKTGKGSKRPHFAHYQLSPNCKPETILHSSFKKMLIDYLNEKLQKKDKIIINWDCSLCNTKYTGNIIEKVAYIKEEYSLKNCRPDIALIDKEDKVIAVIEIVVTHKPEQYVLEYYKENNILLVQINLFSDEDLNIIELKFRNPDLVTFCFNRDCVSYSKTAIFRNIMAQKVNCGICFNKIERYYIEINSLFGTILSSDFSEEEINIVQSTRQNIIIKVDKKTKTKKPINICSRCERMRRKYNHRGL